MELKPLGMPCPVHLLNLPNRTPQPFNRQHISTGRSSREREGPEIAMLAALFSIEQNNEVPTVMQTFGHLPDLRRPGIGGKQHSEEVFPLTFIGRFGR